jgi:hypothetical protein
MNSEAQKTQKSRFIDVAIGVGIPILFFMFRFTAAAAFLIFLLLCIGLRWHRSRRALHVAFALFAAAILIPVDVYIRGWHGPLVDSKRSGPRLVEVLYGLGARRTDGGEYISGGCVVAIHDTRWRLVWD